MDSANHPARDQVRREKASIPPEIPPSNTKAATTKRGRAKSARQKLTANGECTRDMREYCADPIAQVQDERNAKSGPSAVNRSLRPRACAGWARAAGVPP